MDDKSVHCEASGQGDGRDAAIISNTGRESEMSMVSPSLQKSRLITAFRAASIAIMFLSAIPLIHGGVKLSPVYWICLLIAICIHSVVVFFLFSECFSRKYTLIVPFVNILFLIIEGIILRYNLLKKNNKVKFRLTAFMLFMPSTVLLFTFAYFSQEIDVFVMFFVLSISMFFNWYFRKKHLEMDELYRKIETVILFIVAVFCILLFSGRIFPFLILSFLYVFISFNTVMDVRGKIDVTLNGRRE